MTRSGSELAKFRRKKKRTERLNTLFDVRAAKEGFRKVLEAAIPAKQALELLVKAGKEEHPSIRWENLRGLSGLSPTLGFGMIQHLKRCSKLLEVLIQRCRLKIEEPVERPPNWPEL